MEGRWTIEHHSGISEPKVIGDFARDQRVPVVPCDDAAIERAASAIGDALKERQLDVTMLELAQEAFRAARTDA